MEDLIKNRIKETTKLIDEINDKAETIVNDIKRVIEILEKALSKTLTKSKNELIKEALKILK
jgi:hypothetical protein